MITERYTDDDEPVTEEWLRDACRAPATGRLVVGPAELFCFASGPRLLIDHHFGEFPLRTRGAVRLMCRALGIAFDG
jgi:hypothetical protein